MSLKTQRSGSRSELAAADAAAAGRVSDQPRSLKSRDASGKLATLELVASKIKATPSLHHDPAAAGGGGKAVESSEEKMPPPKKKKSRKKKEAEDTASEPEEPKPEPATEKKKPEPAAEKKKPEPAATAEKKPKTELKRAPASATRLKFAGRREDHAKRTSEPEPEVLADTFLSIFRPRSSNTCKYCARAHENPVSPPPRVNRESLKDFIKIEALEKKRHQKPPEADSFDRMDYPEEIHERLLDTVPAGGIDPKVDFSTRLRPQSPYSV